MLSAITHRLSSVRGHHPRRSASAHVRRPLLEQLETRCLLTAIDSVLDANPHNVSVDSLNLYVGVDLAQVLEAAVSGDPLTIAAAVGRLMNGVRERDFPARAASFAQEIAQSQPALIGLQEVSLFVTDNVYYLDGTVVPESGETIDYLDILLDELDELGLHYEPVAVVNDFGGEFTALVDPLTYAFQEVLYVDRDVILARTDLPEPALSLSNPQAGNFATSVPLNIGEMELQYLRGWVSVDVQMWGMDVRVVNAHLEDDNPDIPEFGMVQMAQAAELVGPGGPTDTDMPVILIGDFNSPADGSGTATYQILTLGAGFTDAWTVTHGVEPGYTWTQNDLLRDDPCTVAPPPTDDPQRIDLILTRGDLQPRSMERLMLPVTPSDSATGPLWPSDHAGVAATIGIHVGADGREYPWTVVNDDPLTPGEQALFVVGTDQRDYMFLSRYANGNIAVVNGGRERIASDGRRSDLRPRVRRRRPGVLLAQRSPFRHHSRRSRQ